mgnify:CR=1 FL=1
MRPNTLELSTFIAVGRRLIAETLLPSKLRELIAEAVRAVRGCSWCGSPLGAWHDDYCTLSAGYGHERTHVRRYDLGDEIEIPE